MIDLLNLEKDILVKGTYLVVLFLETFLVDKQPQKGYFSFQKGFYYRWTLPFFW